MTGTVGISSTVIISVLMLAMMVPISVANTVSRASSKALRAPSNTPRESRVEQVAIAHSVRECHAAVQRDVVEAPVPDRCVQHAVCGKGHDGANDSSGDDVVPVVEFVDSERTADEDRAEDGGVDGDELPHCRVVVCKHLELRVEVQREVDEASESRGGVAAGERLQAVVNLVWVSGANIPREVNLLESGSV